MTKTKYSSQEACRYYRNTYLGKSLLLGWIAWGKDAKRKMWGNDDSISITILEWMGYWVGADREDNNIHTRGRTSFVADLSDNNRKIIIDNIKKRIKQ